MQRDSSFSLLLLCFFLSGTAGLVYETAWTKEFAFVFGTSNLAVATVLAAYMAGLASGAALAARFAHRVTRPVLSYGLLELGIGLTALAVPTAISVSRGLYVAIFGGLEGLPDTGGLTTAGFYLVCSFAILMVPTAMMGATLPLLVRHAVRNEEQIGSRIGLLYAINTAGAVAGVVLAAFVLLPSLGLRQTIWVAAALNGGVFLAAWALARTSAPVSSVPPEAQVCPPERAATHAEGEFESQRASWILPLIFVSGALSFTYEVLWVRLLGHVVGGSLYAFATMLATFLLGIALGAAVASRLGRTRQRAAHGFAIAQLGIAVLSWLAYHALAFVPLLTSHAQRTGMSRQVVDIVLSMGILFPAALLIGATFPFAVRVLTRSEVDAGSSSARVYAVNTLGSVVGSVGAGFFVIPALGYAGTLTLCIAANLGLAIAAATIFGRRQRVLIAVACASLVLLAVRLPQPPWTILRYGSLARVLRANNQVEFLGVGRAATVLLVESRLRFYLRTNGLPEGLIDTPMVAHNMTVVARWLGVLPSLARPEARSLLIVGFGAGVAIETVPSTIEQIDVVELEPEVLAANRQVGERRWIDPFADPRLRVHVNDARNALLLTTSRFDAIVSQPSHPWSSGASHLYTREFFELSKSRLSDDGVFVQWIGNSFVDDLLFRSMLATLNAVFENVRVYSPQGQGGLLFIASDTSLDIESSSARAIEAATEDYARLAIAVPDDVTSRLVLDERGTRELAEGAPITRDDFNLLHSRSPRVGDRSLVETGDELLAPFDPITTRGLGDDPFYLMRVLPPRRAMRLLESLPDATDRVVAQALFSLSYDRGRRARELLEQALREMPRHRVARAAMLIHSILPIQGGADPGHFIQAPLEPAEQTVVDAWLAARDRDFAALRSLERALAAIPPDHLLAPDAQRLRARWRIESGERALALEAVELAGRIPMIFGGRRGDQLLRARGLVVAEEYGSALEALTQIPTLPFRSPRQRRSAFSRGKRILESIPDEPQLARLRNAADRGLSALPER